MQRDEVLRVDLRFRQCGADGLRIEHREAVDLDGLLHRAHCTRGGAHTGTIVQRVAHLDGIGTRRRNATGRAGRNDSHVLHRDEVVVRPIAHARACRNGTGRADGGLTRHVEGEAEVQRGAGSCDENGARERSGLVDQPRRTVGHLLDERTRDRCADDGVRLGERHVVDVGHVAGTAGGTCGEAELRQRATRAADDDHLAAHAALTRGIGDVRGIDRSEGEARRLVDARHAGGVRRVGAQERHRELVRGVDVVVVERHRVARDNGPERLARGRERRRRSVERCHHRPGADIDVQVLSGLEIVGELGRALEARLARELHRANARVDTHHDERCELLTAQIDEGIAVPVFGSEGAIGFATACARVLTEQAVVVVAEVAERREQVGSATQLRGLVEGPVFAFGNKLSNPAAHACDGGGRVDVEDVDRLDLEQDLFARVKQESANVRRHGAYSFLFGPIGLRVHSTSSGRVVAGSRVTVTCRLPGEADRRPARRELRAQAGRAARC